MKKGDRKQLAVSITYCDEAGIPIPNLYEGYYSTREALASLEFAIRKWEDSTDKSEALTLAGKHVSKIIVEVN